MPGAPVGVPGGQPTGPPPGQRPEPALPYPNDLDGYLPRSHAAGHTYPVPPGYGPPPVGAAPVNAGVLGRRRRPFLVWPVLPIVSALTYCPLWIYRTNRELAAYNPRIQVRPVLSVLAFTVGWLLVVPPFVATWRLGTRIRDARGAAGLSPIHPGMAFTLLLLGGGAAYLQTLINKIWECYPGAVEGQRVPLSSASGPERAAKGTEAARHGEGTPAARRDS